MDRVETVSLLGSLGLLLLVLELVRRRQLAAGYALLWLLTACVLLVLSVWRSLLDTLAHLLGIFYPPAALFLVGFGFVLLILLQFSLTISRLTHENKVLAQRIGLLNYRLDQVELRREPSARCSNQQPESVIDGQFDHNSAK